MRKKAGGGEGHIEFSTRGPFNNTGYGENKTGLGGMRVWVLRGLKSKRYANYSA